MRSACESGVGLSLVLLASPAAEALPLRAPRTCFGGSGHRPRATANTEGHHAAAPGGRDTGTQEERAAIASLRRARAEDQSSAHALG